ncbi:MAG TPA: response regulator [Terriglobia bacterium]|nr:response regulator [Terriglobia bacterium]
MKRILVVDDERNLLKLYEKELREEGYEVLTASSGREALGFLDGIAFDLVILDIRMPEMDGMETLRRIMESPSSPPLILNTAYSMYKDDFLTWAADAYVVKSSDLSELKTKTSEILKRSSKTA